MGTAVIGALRVVLGLDKAEYSAGLTAAQKELRTAGRQMQSMGAGFARVGAGLTATVTAPLIALGFQASKAATEAKDAMGQVTAALKSMGGAAGQTTESLSGMASDIMRNSLYDDDDILRQVTANLLTFGKVAGDEFRRAQVAAADLATRMGGDLQSATILVGKALNDPIRGMGALRKAGVQLSDGQQALVKSLVATGDVAGAQRILLGELESQFGGSARAAQDTDPYDSLRDSLNDLSESMGGMINAYLKPMIDGLASLAAGFNGLSPEVQKFALIGTVIAAATGPALIAIGGIVGALGTLTAAFAGGGILAGLGAFALAAAPFVAGAVAIAGAVYLFRDDLVPVFEAFRKAVMDAVGPMLPDLLASAQAAFAALGPAISAVVGVVGPVLAGLTKVFLAAFGPPIVTLVKVLVAGITNAFAIIAQTLRVLSALLTGDFQGAWNAAGTLIGTIVQGIGRVIDAVFPGALGMITRFVDGVKKWFTVDLFKVFDDAKRKVHEVGDAFYTLWDRVVGHSYIPDLVIGVGTWMGRLQQAMVDPAAKATKDAGDQFQEMRDRVRGIMEGLLTDREKLDLGYSKELADLNNADAVRGLSPEVVAEMRRRSEARYRSASAGIDADGLSQADVPDLNTSFPEIERFQSMWKSMQDKIKASRDDFADAFEYGISAALRGDWKGVLQSIFGDVMSQGLKGLGASIFDQLGGKSGEGFSLGNIGSAIGKLFKSLPGFANGGSILPGGSGGIDSQVVAFRKSPTEQVDIHTPGKDAGPWGGSRGGDTYDMRGAFVPERFMEQVDAKVARGEARVRKDVPGIVNRGMATGRVGVPKWA